MANKKLLILTIAAALLASNCLVGMEKKDLKIIIKNMSGEEEIAVLTKLFNNSKAKAMLSLNKIELIIQKKIPQSLPRQRYKASEYKTIEKKIMEVVNQLFADNEEDKKIKSEIKNLLKELTENLKDYTLVLKNINTIKKEEELPVNREDSKRTDSLLITPLDLKIPVIGEIEEDSDLYD